MLLFKQVDFMQAWLSKQAAAGKRIGFVPTMGALHEGHLALVRQSRTENDQTVVSIFVNPTQFNQPEDLKAYPRLPGPDILALSREGVDVLFLPDQEAVYPPGLDTRLHIDLQGLDRPMEGQFRPGHFAGVAQVVHRLLAIVRPHRLYMGQKDYQQAAIIRHLLNHTDHMAQLRVHPTVREKDGLAMSSRNLRLAPDLRQRAVLLYQTLLWVKKAYQSGQPVADIEANAMQRLQQPDFRPEYVKIVDGVTLQGVRQPGDHTIVVCCLACWAGSVRLIDNLILSA